MMTMVLDGWLEDKISQGEEMEKYWVVVVVVVEENICVVLVSSMNLKQPTQF